MMVLNIFLANIYKKYPSLALQSSGVFLEFT